MNFFANDHALELVHAKLNQIIEALAALKENPRVYTPLTTSELAQHLKVSSRTIQNWRDHGEISFRKAGRNIWYTYEDVSAFLERKKNASWK